MTRPRDVARMFFGAAVLVAVGGCADSTPGHGGGFIAGDSAVFEPPAVDGGDADAPPEDADALAEDAAVDGAGGTDGGSAAWAGTWTFVSGSQGLACDGELSVVAVSGSIDITPAGAGLTVREDGCVFQFTLAGAVATSAPGQSCAAWAVPTIPTWTLTMQDDGTLFEALGGRVYIGGEICTISGTSKLVRE